MHRLLPSGHSISTFVFGSRNFSVGAFLVIQIHVVVCWLQFAFFQQFVLKEAACSPKIRVPPAKMISLKWIAGIGSLCLGVLSLDLMSANMTDMTNMNRYAEGGHPCLMPDCWKKKSDLPSSQLTLNLGRVHICLMSLKSRRGTSSLARLSSKRHKVSKVIQVAEAYTNTFVNMYLWYLVVYAWANLLHIILYSVNLITYICSTVFYSMCVQVLTHTYFITLSYKTWTWFARAESCNDSPTATALTFHTLTLPITTTLVKTVPVCLQAS